MKDASRPLRLPLLTAFVAVLLATLLRWWPLDTLGGRVPWVTFYPAVIIAALYGGFLPGVIATTLSGVAAWLVVPHLVGAPVIKDVVDSVGLLAFVLTGTAVSALAEARWRSQAHERQASLERDQMFNLSPDMLCLATPDGFFRRVNPAFTRALGWSEPELLARPILEFIHPEDRPATEREFARPTAVGGEILQFENRWQHRDGSWHWLSWRYVTQPDRHRYASARDITTYKQAQEALARAERENATEQARIAFIFQTIPIGIALTRTDALGRESRVINEAHLRLCGITRAQADEPGIFQRLTHPDDRLRQAPFLSSVAAGDCVHYAMDKRYVRADGSVVWVLFSFHRRTLPAGGFEDLTFVVDITERKRVEDELRQSQEKLAVTLQSIGDAVLATDTNGRVSHLNPVGEQLTGWPMAEALGRPVGEVFRVINEETREPAGIPVERVLATGMVQGLANHTLLIARDGTEHPIADSAAPIRDAAQNTLGVVLVFHDVTRQREAERRIAALLQESKDIRTALDEHSIVAITDPQGRITFVNDQFCTISGYPREALLGRDHRMLNSGHHPKTFIRDLWNTILQGRVWKGLIKNRAKDGSYYWTDTTIVPFHRADGRPYQFVAVRTDITARMQAEEELHRLNTELEHRVEERTAEIRQALATLDATLDGAFAFAPDTLRFTFVNRGAMRQLGYTREELLGMKLTDIERNASEADVRRAIEPLRRGEKSVLTFSRNHRHKDGHEFPVEMNLQHVTPAGGAPRFIAIVRDVTERKKAEQLAYRSQRLESLGTLAGGVAHDLNNALSPILMGIEMIRMQHPAEAGLIDLLQTSAKRAADMVRQLLTFARGAEGASVPVQTSSLLREMQKIIEGTFPKNVQLVVRAGQDLPPVSGDPTQLHQVLLNLCVNARDAMPNGGTLRLETQAVTVDATFASSLPDARPGEFVTLRVTDSGTGIPPELIDRIFDPFFTTKGPDKGTGLGLSTVLGIVRGHGGFIQVYSHPAKGSAFTVYLPALDTRATPAVIQPEGAAFHGTGESILFVDDEPAMRETARVVLQRLNFKPITATDGADGLIRAAEHRDSIRAVITDLHMPHMDGLMFLRALRRMLPNVAVAVISGRLEEKETEECRSLGVATYLDKPFTEHQLGEVLRTLLAQK
ncbi:PAS domain S-box protein [Opitutus sp. ER46]|uniref:PAS domain S-box protein n=1 Tax=Opitutus sp. ER46 TaxID=2161864 RepID=UPI000D2F7A66|nr:PAS domain S-box protein [Opitutus sp. ER46]PTY01267.1 hypothetical protein DB354_00115 [Opitutus sp. ER46]